MSSVLISGWDAGQSQKGLDLGCPRKLPTVNGPMQMAQAMAVGNEMYSTVCFIVDRCGENAIDPMEKIELRRSRIQFSKRFDIVANALLQFQLATIVDLAIEPDGNAVSLD